jgi:uncharacterized protein (DUF4415 family)
MKKLTKEQKREIVAIAAKKGEDIDLSEMPEVIDWSDAEIGKFYRPPKRPVTMRLDADVVEWLKSTQTIFSRYRRAYLLLQQDLTVIRC